MSTESSGLRIVGTGLTAARTHDRHAVAHAALEAAGAVRPSAPSPSSGPAPRRDVTLPRLPADVETRARSPRALTAGYRHQRAGEGTVEPRVPLGGRAQADRHARRRRQRTRRRSSRPPRPRGRSRAIISASAAGSGQRSGDRRLQVHRRPAVRNAVERVLARRDRRESDRPARRSSRSERRPSRAAGGRPRPPAHARPSIAPTRARARRGYPLCRT